MPLNNEQKHQPINQVFLSGVVRQISALRYTPAGIPIVECMLEYREAADHRTVVINLPILLKDEWAMIAKSLENKKVLLKGKLMNGKKSVVIEGYYIEEVDHGICSNT